jgi:DNA-binding CsgD family transcriptional regulator
MQPTSLYEHRSFTDPEPNNQSTSTEHDGFISNTLAHWMEADQRARVLVDNQLRTWWVSRAAESLLTEPSALLIRNGYLRTRDSRFDRHLRALTERTPDDLIIECIHDERTGEQVVIVAQRLDPPLNHFIGLTLQRANGEFELRLADLSGAFGFTPTEARVAYHLLLGCTAEETAEKLRVSLETVRTHIKRAYAKLGVGSREAFFHRLTPFVILLA